MQRNKDHDSYIKFIAVIDIIKKYSDEKHAISVEQIKEKIYELEHEFQIDFRIVKKYVENYNQYHHDDIIVSYKEGKKLYFYYNRRDLDIMEAKAILDLVYSSHFFTLKTKENYQKRIQDMFSNHYQQYFHKNLNLHIVKNENADVFYNELEMIVCAIQEHKKIRFEYHKPSLNQNQTYKETELAPIDTIFSNNEYYLLCQGAKNPNECIQYRLDYVKNVQIVQESEFYFNALQLQSFQEKINHMSYMYGEGHLEPIELDFSPAVYSNIIDKFGKNIHPKKINDQLYRIQVSHIINSTFYSWIIGFGGQIKISGNEQQIIRFKEFLKNQFLD